jgi:hypothetical protein
MKKVKVTDKLESISTNNIILLSLLFIASYIVYNVEFLSTLLFMTIAYISVATVYILGGILIGVSVILLSAAILHTLSIIGSLFALSILFISNRIQEHSSLIGSLFKIVILIPSIAYIGLCTITVLMMGMGNILFSSYIIHLLDISGTLSHTIYIVNFIIGVIGLGVLSFGLTFTEE